jgi:hydroxymethylpyrimidine/phosphomethylpyrimidine kinase
MIKIDEKWRSYADAKKIFQNNAMLAAARQNEMMRDLSTCKKFQGALLSLNGVISSNMREVHAIEKIETVKQENDSARQGINISYMAPPGVGVEA